MNPQNKSSLQRYGAVENGPYADIKKRREQHKVRGDVVGVSGFEPEASWSRTKRDTKLRHTPSKATLRLYNKQATKSRGLSDFFKLFFQKTLAFFP